MLYRFDDFSLDTDRRELRRGTDIVRLEPQVFDLLVYLIRNRERVVSKDDLIAAIWGGRIVSESALTTRINAVRGAIGDSGEAQRLIKTFQRKGIRFVGAVREEQQPAVAATAAAPIAAEPAAPALALPDRPSIAVLPFANVSGDSEQEYFADGMADEIITALSRCSWLFVIARNSSFTYKGRAVDVRQVGRELGVRYVLEGSVRRGGNRAALRRATRRSGERRAHLGGPLRRRIERRVRAAGPHHRERGRRDRAEAAVRRGRPVEAEAGVQPRRLRPVPARASTRIRIHKGEP